MNAHKSPRVDASIDAIDDEGLDAIDQAGQARVLRKLKKELRFLREEDKLNTNQRAKRAVRVYQYQICKKHAGDTGFFEWNSNRALDRQDFEYLFQHRQRFPRKIHTWLEIIASKITHINKDGQPGYFNELEQNIGWTDYITPLLFTGAEIVDKLVRCGIWANSANSRRCHKQDFCPNCLWNDMLKALAAAFGEASGAFYRALAWWFVTISWTTNPLNAKCVSGVYEPDQNKPPKGDRGYEPYPIVLGINDQDWDLGFSGCQDARTLGLIMEEVMGHVYHSATVDGYRLKLEGCYRLNPGGANRVNLHSHTVANGRDLNGQHLAEALRETITRLVNRAVDSHKLARPYYVDIQVKRISSPEHLENAIEYTEKTVPIRRMVADAMSRPEAKLPDGSWNPGYAGGLAVALERLVRDEIPAIFSGARLEIGLPPLFRRKTVGNMLFKDNGTCIGDEPEWHRAARRRHAKKQRKIRQERKRKRKELEAKMRKAGKPVPVPKRYARRRKNPRRLARSLQSKSKNENDT
jgi:hypothetical protein